MATKFLEPGGDATFNVADTTHGGFWRTVGSGAVIATDFINGLHQKSIKSSGVSGSSFDTPFSTISDTGARVSFYLYIATLPNATASFASLFQSSSGKIALLRLTTGGILQLWSDTAQIGTNGSTLSTGKWYRISIAYTVTSTVVNRFEVFVDGVSSISVTNGTLGNTTTSRVVFGNNDSNSVFDMRFSDFYIDDSNSLTDTGNVWVTAKRPNANGTLVQFTTQIGSGGSGYGTGHSQQVNERPLSNTNGWSIQSASKQTEEYSVEGSSVGDMNIAHATIVDFVGWVDCKVGVNSTGNIIVAGVASNIAVITTETMFTKAAGSTTYPTGSTDIGMDNNTVNQLFSLFECGIMVAFIAYPGFGKIGPFPTHFVI